MGQDYRTEKVFALSRVNELAREQDPHRHHHPPPHPHPPYASEEPAGQHSVADVASVLGLPEGVLTPAVVEAVVGLLGELDRLRWRDEHHERRVVLLEGLADHHSVVPALNRRAFVRELDLFLAGGEAHGALAMIHVGGVERLRLVHGLAAGEGALRHVCANLLGALRRSDAVGLLGGSDFAVLLPATDGAAARAKLAEVIARINAQPFTWLGQPMVFDISLGVHALAAGEEGGEAALAAADRARRGLD